jgi:hypothetical protein
MRLVIVVGALALAAGTASGAYVIELDGGDRMTVDSYWQEGDRMHLMRDGVDLSVPRGRIRSIRETDEPLVPPKAAKPAPATGASGQSTSREDLEAQQGAIERHLLRVQQERFEAQARGEKPATLKRLTKEFQRTQARRRDTARAIDRLDGAR